MELKDYIDNIKFQLTGGVLESEIDDKGYENIINMSLKELNRYYNGTRLLELDCPGTCIDISDHPEINTIVNVYRLNGTSVGADSNTDSTIDPVAMSQLQMYNFGSGYYSQSWIHNYSAYTLTQRLSNTMSTDLNFKEDKDAKKLYINLPMGVPPKITIEYIPQLNDVSDVIGEYWSDILLKLALAYAKIALGRIRTRFKQSNALWEGDGDTILAEGTSELSALRETLRTANDYTLPVD